MHVSVALSQKKMQQKRTHTRGLACCWQKFYCQQFSLYRVCVGVCLCESFRKSAACTHTANLSNAYFIYRQLCRSYSTCILYIIKFSFVVVSSFFREPAVVACRRLCMYGLLISHRAGICTLNSVVVVTICKCPMSIHIHVNILLFVVFVYIYILPKK